MDKYGKQLAATEREMREVLSKARAITSAAAEAGRGITEDEEKELKGYLSEVEVLKEKKLEIEGAMATRQRVEDAGASIVVDEDARREQIPAHRKADSLGDAFVKSEGYKGLMTRGISGSWSTGAIDIEGKATLTTLGTGGDTAGGSLIVEQVQGGIMPKLFERLTVAGLMAQGSTNSNLVRYMREILATNAADGTAEGAAKPESSLEFDAVDESVKKIATFLPVSDEMLEDAPALASYINARLALFVQIEEERELLNGDGVNEVLGLVGRIPANNKGMRSSVTTPNDADHIFRAMSRVREAFLEPDGIVIHPNDWEGIVTMKSGISNDNTYLGPGPFLPEHGKTLWGMRVVVTSAVAEAAPIVGAWGSAAQIFRKGGLTVEASNSHSDFFQKNLTAIRAEERLALAVYRPEAFAVADLGASGAGT